MVKKRYANVRTLFCWICKIPNVGHEQDESAEHDCQKDKHEQKYWIFHIVFTCLIRIWNHVIYYYYCYLKKKIMMKTKTSKLLLFAFVEFARQQRVSFHFDHIYWTFVVVVVVVRKIFQTQWKLRFRTLKTETKMK